MNIKRGGAKVGGAVQRVTTMTVVQPTHLPTLLLILLSEENEMGGPLHNFSSVSWSVVVGVVRIKKKKPPAK
jgi:hypothetical protein